MKTVVVTHNHVKRNSLGSCLLVVFLSRQMIQIFANILRNLVKFLTVLLCVILVCYNFNISLFQKLLEYIGVYK